MADLNPKKDWEGNFVAYEWFWYIFDYLINIQ